MKTKEKIKHEETCPYCNSNNVTQIADHSIDGYNGFVCEDCGCHFGH